MRRISVSVSTILVAELGSESVKKKRKKSKRKHHSARGDSAEVISSRRRAREDDVPSHKPIKLKIKLGDQLISSSDATL